MDDTLSILASLIWVLALGMWPVGFMFGMCSPCCDPCPWMINLDRCLRIEVVGSSKNEGWDCRLTPWASENPESDVAYANPIAIRRLPSRVVIPIRLTLSAQGESRTPVAEVRTQVWRLLRPTVSDASVYDFVGPPWFLQVELIVTGVETEAEAAITSSLGVDEHGQSKLIIDARQGPTPLSVTHTVQVELSLTGAQRYLPPTTTAFSMQLASGQSYAGWGVIKAAGREVTERTLAIEFGLAPFNSLCYGAQVARKVILNDPDAVVDFLNGDRDISVFAQLSFGSPFVEVSLRAMPQNALCEVNDFAVGLALGIYPDRVYADVPQSVINTQPMWCGDNTLTLRPFGGIGGTHAVPIFACMQPGWGLANYMRSFARLPTFGVSGPFVTPEVFWPGRTLLWNLEHGPYRRSAEDSVVGYTYKLDGSGHDEAAWSHLFADCPPGFRSVSAEVFPSIDNTLCIPDGTVVFNVTAQVQVTYNVLDSVNESDPRDYSVSSRTETASITVPMTAGSWDKTQKPPRIAFFGNAFVQIAPPVFGQFPNQWEYFFGGFGVSVTAAMQAPASCEQAGTLSLSFVTGSPAATYTLNQTYTASQFRIIALEQTYPTSAALVSAQASDASFAHLRRFRCTDWTPAEIPPEGATLSRECALDDDSVVPPGGWLGAVGNRHVVVDSYVPRFAEFAASPLHLPRLLPTNVYRSFDGILLAPTFLTGSTLILQRKNCEIARLIRHGYGDDSSTPEELLDVVARPLERRVSRFLAGECRLFVLVFGNNPPSTPSNLLASVTCDDRVSGDGTPRGPAVRTTVGCDGCVPVLEVTAGQNNGTVKQHTSGDKSGLIEIVALRTWLGGEGVTFTASCGSDTKTLRVRRADTVPERIGNLSAVREPCDTITLAWTAPHDGGQPITNYIVQYRPLGSPSWITLVRPASTDTTAAVPGLLRLGYDFRVAAVNSVGEALFAAVSLGFILGPPTNLTATRGPCEQVALSWTPPAQDVCIVVVSYRVEYRAINVSAWTTFATVPGNVTTATVTGLDPATAYQFRVARIDDANTAAFSPTARAGEVPPAPINVIAVAGNSQATLTWEGGEDPCVTNTNHTVQFRPTTASTWTTFGSTGSATKSATVTGLTNGVEYRFRVRAINSVGNGSYSAESNAVTPTA